MNITRTHRSIDRYEFDAGMCSSSNGYAQIDTKQDASYYGQWANPFTRTLVSYVEGDICVIECETDEEFIAEVRSNAAWTDEYGYGPLKIDPGWNHEAALGARFTELGLGDLLY